MDKKIGIVSIVVNIVLAALVTVLLLNKSGLLSQESVSEYTYTSNPQYEACLSTFELYKGDADIIFAGDSITAKCNFEEFFPDVNSINRGIGSDITEGLYNRMDEILSHKPKKIFIMVGINDIGNGVPEQTSMSYYRKIIEMIKSVDTECDIYIESVLPTTQLDLKQIAHFNSELESICKSENVEYIDLFSDFLSGGSTDTNLISADGVHLNGKGYSKLIASIGDYLYD